jgi:hypothetical protein
MFGVGLVFCLPNVSISQEWRGIRPLHSTCDDIKRILNVTTCEPGDNTYDLGDERILVTFSKTRCDKAWQKFWNVPPLTVMSIERSLRKLIPLGDFHIDENKYEKVFTDFTDQVMLTSKDEGIQFSVIKGEVNRITYTPTPKDDYLLCPNSPKPSKDLKTGNFLPWFDKYEDIPFSREKESLDYFARELALYGPGWKGYIVVYGPLKSETRERAERVRNYLVKKRGIDGKRIQAIAGGRREKLEVELYILPPNATPPIPHPTVDPS